MFDRATPDSYRMDRVQVVTVSCGWLHLGSVSFKVDMSTISKRQVIKRLKEQLVECATHESHDLLIGYRIDPAPITIHADKSKNGDAEFEGWILFENASSDDCLGYCEHPWGDGWAYFRNPLEDTRKGDFSAASFGKSLAEILDQMKTLDALNNKIA